MRHISTEHLTAIVNQTEIDPVILFGAGASATSGVPMAHDMATLAARWATAMHKGWKTDDPRDSGRATFKFSCSPKRCSQRSQRTSR